MMPLRFVLPFAALFLAPVAAAWSGGSTLDCASTERRTVHCPIDTRGGVALIRQHSRAACIEGYSWGWDRRGVWVSQGCRAEFEAGGPRWSGPPPHWDRGSGWAGPPPHWDRGPRWSGPPPHWDRGSGWASAPQLIRCESIGNRVQYCALGPIRSIRLHRQLSRSDCREGRSWGLDRGALWVTHGCRGEFAAW